MGSGGIVAERSGRSCRQRLRCLEIAWIGFCQGRRSRRVRVCLVHKARTRTPAGTNPRRLLSEWEPENGYSRTAHAIVVTRRKSMCRREKKSVTPQNVAHDFIIVQTRPPSRTSPFPPRWGGSQHIDGVVSYRAMTGSHSLAHKTLEAFWPSVAISILTRCVAALLNTSSVVVVPLNGLGL